MPTLKVNPRMAIVRVLDQDHAPGGDGNRFFPTQLFQKVNTTFDVHRGAFEAAFKELTDEGLIDVHASQGCLYTPKD